jgi:RNA polymerase sigma-70 factor (ECF subfamily)
MAAAPSQPDSRSDEALVRAVREGQTEAFDALASRYYGMVYAIAYSRLNDRDQAEDLAQEVFLRAYLLLGQLHSPAQFTAWLGRMARNLAIDWIRRGERASRLMPMIPIEDSHAEIPDRQTPSARDQAESTEEHSALHHALTRLPAEHREIVLLHYMEGMSTREIASRLGMHQSTVSRQMNRALQGLHGMLEPVLREGTARLRARPQARARVLGVAASVAVLPVATKAKLAAGAIEGLKGLGSMHMGGGGLAQAGSGIAQLFSFLFSGGLFMGKAKVITGAAVAVAVVLIGGVTYQQLNQSAKPVRPLTPAGAVSLADTQPLTLARDIPVGRKITLRMETNSIMQISDAPNLPEAMKKAMNQQSRQVQDMALTVREKRPEGGKVVEVEILAVETNTNAGGQEVAYNSRDPKPAIPAGNPGSDMMRAMYDAMIGKKILLYLDSENKVEKTEGFEEMMAGMAEASPAPMREMMKQMMKSIMSPESARDTYGQFVTFDDYPDMPVRTNDSWTRSRTLTLPFFGPAQVTNTYRFAGWQNVHGRRMALITNESKFAGTEPGQGLMGFQFNRMEMDAAGNTYYDPEIEYMRTSDMNTKGVVEASMSFPGSPSPIQMKLHIDQRVTITVVDVDDSAMAKAK